MTNATFTGPTAEATAEFVEWLRSCLKSPENAERHADALLGNHDWDARRTVEVRGFYTRSANPETYTFAESDLLSETIEPERA